MKPGDRRCLAAWPTSASTLAGLLRQRAGEQPDRIAYRFLSDGELESARLTYRELARRAQAVAGLLEEARGANRPCLLLYPAGLDFVVGLWGCFLAGAVAVPCPPPRLNRRSDRLRAIVADARPEIVLASASLAARKGVLSEAYPQLLGAAWLTGEEAAPAPAQEWSAVEPSPESLALLQYTSGSTSDPRGVALTHANLVANEGMIAEAFEHSAETVVVGWLPLYHDMGLIGNVIQPVFVGGECVLMSPGAFLQRPRRWLETIGRYRATSSGAPNFAYDLCVERIPPAERAGLELSSWEVAYNGAEPVRVRTLERFAAAFAGCGFRAGSAYPCYGLAEATLFVSGGGQGRAPRMIEETLRPEVPSGTERRRVSCGWPRGETRVLVVDREAGRPLPDGEEGEIWVSGPAVAVGYWQRIAETDATFHATVPGDGSTSYLRTGDLGYLDQGELFVSGRLKDLVILEGRNHHSQDLEETAEAARVDLSSGACAAFGIDDERGELLVMVCEVGPREPVAADGLAQAIGEALAREHQIAEVQLVVVRRGELLRTTSGKLRRRACRSAYLEARFPVLEERRWQPEAPGSGPSADRPTTASSLRLNWEAGLAQVVAEVCGVEPAEGQPLHELGLDSVTALEIKRRAEERLGLALPIDALLDGSSLVQIAARLGEVEPAGPSSTPGSGHLGRASFAQEGLWFLARLEPESGVHNLFVAAALMAGYERERLDRALGILIARHDALRIAFREREGVLFWFEVEQPWRGLEEISLPSTESGTLVAHLQREAHQPFDLEQGPLLRVCVFTAPGMLPHLLLVIHHAVCDLSSLTVLARDLAALYSAVSPPPPPPALQFRSYLAAHRARIEGPEGERLVGRWRARLGETAPLELPWDHPRPARFSFRGASIDAHLDLDVLQGLAGLARRVGGTPFAVLVSVFAVLLHRYSGQQSFVLGSPANGRVRSELAELVGYLANLLVLRFSFSSRSRFEELVRGTAAEVREALADQELPFARLVQELGQARDPSRPPLVQAVFVEQRLATGAGEALALAALGAGGVGLRLGELELETVEVPRLAAQFDLTLSVADGPMGLRLSFQYARDLFEPATVERLARNFSALALDAVRRPQIEISRLQLLTEEERAQLLTSRHLRNLGTADDTLHGAFSRQAAVTPDRVAVVAGEESWTYGVLESWTAALAARLLDLGLGAEARVGLLCGRGVELVAGILAVLRAGGAYVPLDSDPGVSRARGLLEDADISVLLAAPPFLERALELDRPVISVDSARKTIQPGRRRDREVWPNNLAYVLFTSGSTGRPKGVAVSHRNVLALLEASAVRFDFTRDDVWTLFHSASFDFSVWELWGALLQGSRLVLVPEGTARDPGAFLELVEREGVTVLNQTPAAFRQLIREDGRRATPGAASLRWVIFGGEALDLHALEPWVVRREGVGPALVNMYGITETTVHVTWCLLEPSACRSLAAHSPIGAPLVHLSVRLLDRHLEPVPRGAVGEICVAGLGLARCYLRRPELTAERFVPAPASALPGERLYRSGDLARLRVDGGLEYLGRADRQVKVRGFRIEPAEIEAALAAHPQVREAVVISRLLREDRVGAVGDSAPASVSGPLRSFLKASSRDADEPVLVAYLVAMERSVPADELRLFLGQRLPPYMVPHTFLWLPALPLSRNGKVDRGALPAPERVRPELRSSFEPPRGPAEQSVAGAFATVLGVDRVGALDNFFDLGGDSIRAIRLSAEARGLGLELPVALIYQSPTVRQLAQLAARDEESSGQPAAPVGAFDLISAADRAALPATVVTSYPLARIQSGVIFHSQLEPASPLYHDLFFYRLELPFDERAMRAALDELGERHDILRTTFDLASFSQPLQLVHRDLRVELAVLDLSQLDLDGRDRVQAAWTEEERRRPFDWGAGPLLRVFVHRLAAGCFDLVLSFHDAILDGWSAASLLTELLCRYDGWRQGRGGGGAPQPALRYRDFIALEIAALASEASRAFWQRRLDGVQPTLIGAPAPLRAAETRVVEVGVSEELSDRLKAVARRLGLPVKSVLLGLHLKVLSYVSGQRDLVSGLESNGRVEGRGGDEVLGIHLNTVPLRCRLAAGNWFALADSAFAAESALLPWRRHPLADLQRLAGGPLFDAVFNYTHFHVFEQLSAIGELRAIGARGYGLTHFALRVEVNREPFTDRLSIDLEGNLAWLEPGQLELMAACFARALELASEHGEEPHAGACLFPSSWQQQILAGEPLVGTGAGAGDLDPILAGFATVARHAPDRAALLFRDEVISYGALAGWSDRIAMTLAGLGIGPEDRVALFTPRGPALIAGVLGVLRAGAAYVPLDPTAPWPRNRELLAEVGARVVLSAPQLAVPVDSPCISLPITERVAEAPPASAELRSAADDWLAYVLFTSGSTGPPKGVAVRRGNLAFSSAARHQFYGETPSRFLLVSPIFFDSSVAGLFWTLDSGGALVLPDDGFHEDPAQLARLFGQQQPTHLLCVPGLYAAILDTVPHEALSSLRVVILAGEPFGASLVAAHVATLPDTQLYNEYGPTEATVWCAVARLGVGGETAVHLGRAIPGAELLVLGPDLEPALPGTAGELAVAGPGVTGGYLGRPRLTAEAFAPHPFPSRPGQRVYLTGDRVRLCLDGRLEFLGRRDRQVKIRGHRIELAEVEGWLRSQPGVREAVVVVARGSGSPGLTAYVQWAPEHDLTIAELEGRAMESLPRSMVPSAVVAVDSFALTPNGKIDRARLPDREVARASRVARLVQEVESLSDERARELLERLGEPAASSGRPLAREA